METYRRRPSAHIASGAEDEEIGGMGRMLNLQSYRHLVSHSRDILESMKRYYNNQFTDAEKQEAINLFLHGLTSYGESDTDADRFKNRVAHDGKSLTSWYAN